MTRGGSEILHGHKDNVVDVQDSRKGQVGGEGGPAADREEKKGLNDLLSRA